jgi:hypothetical protein
MRKANNTRKKKEPVKPKHCIVHLKFENKNELENLEQIKKLTGMTVGTKAVAEALANYPQVSKRADALNSELQKVNRDYEQLANKFDTVKRAFRIVNEDEHENAKIKTLNITRCSICEQIQDENMFCKNCD